MNKPDSIRKKETLKSQLDFVMKLNYLIPTRKPAHWPSALSIHQCFGRPGFNPRSNHTKDLKKWYLIPPCLTLCITRYLSRIKWSNPGKGVVSSPTHRCSSYRIQSPILLFFRRPDLVIINQKNLLSSRFCRCDESKREIFKKPKKLDK